MKSKGGSNTAQQPNSAGSCLWQCRNPTKTIPMANKPHGKQTQWKPNPTANKPNRNCVFPGRTSNPGISALSEADTNFGVTWCTAAPNTLIRDSCFGMCNITFYAG